jgi:hypothetical protein
MFKMKPRVLASLACLVTACLVVTVYTYSGILISTSQRVGIAQGAAPSGNSTVLESAVLPSTGTPDLDKTNLGVGRLVANYLIVFFSGCIAAAAGVGGGAIYTPLYIVLFDLM